MQKICSPSMMQQPETRWKPAENLSETHQNQRKVCWKTLHSRSSAEKKHKRNIAGYPLKQVFGGSLTAGSFANRMIFA